MERASPVRWWYYLPHLWEEESTTWEDVYLLPDLPDWERGSLWLTVDAGGRLDVEEDMRRHFVSQLGEANFHLDRERLDMIVRADRFTKLELLVWVRIALAELGYPCDELVEGNRERELFAGSNQHAREVEEATRRAAELNEPAADADSEASASPDSAAQ